MNTEALTSAIESIIDRHETYPPAAYLFFLEVMLKEASSEKAKDNYSCEEISKLICQNIKKKFGIFSKTVLKNWHIYSNKDIGYIIFNMIEAGILENMPGETINDFTGGYDIKEILDVKIGDL